jgi:hypothetical protein
MEQTLAVIAAQPYGLDSDAPVQDAAEVAVWISPSLPPLRNPKAEDVDEELDATIWAAMVRP